MFLVGIVWWLVTGLFAIGSEYIGVGLSELAPVWPSPLYVLYQSLATFVQVLPVLVLGAVLLWGWLQRHPPKERLAGTLDEV